MKIYKLKYQDKETAEINLISKGVYFETEEGLSYGQGIYAIVEIGLIIEHHGTYDEEGNVITEPTFIEGYHYDVMSEQEIEFKSAIDTDSPLHTFAGY